MATRQINVQRMISFKVKNKIQTEIMILFVHLYACITTMMCEHIKSPPELNKPGIYDTVYKDECTRCFDSQVCLSLQLVEPRTHGENRTLRRAQTSASIASTVPVNQFTSTLTLTLAVVTIHQHSTSKEAPRIPTRQSHHSRNQPQKSSVRRSNSAMLTTYAVFSATSHTQPHPHPPSNLKYQPFQPQILKHTVLKLKHGKRS